MKRILAVMLACCLILITTSSTAAAQNSIINDLYPDDESMGMNTDVELIYREIPPENYQWDTNLRFVEWSGILPEFKNPSDVTDNTTASGIFKTSVQIVRLSVFLLQLGFSTNVFVESLEKIEGQLEMISDRFFKEVFPITSTFLVIFMIIAWFRGQIGQMFKLLIVALLVSTMLIGGAKHITTLAKMTAGVIDDISLSIVGILNLDGDSSSAQVGAERVARTNNMIWQVAVDRPWTSGQFGSQNPPAVTIRESDALRQKNVEVAANENWKDLFLKYRPGTRERLALVEVLADDDILHASDDASAMMGELAIPVRMLIAIISLILSITVLVLFGIVTGLMIISGILLLAGMMALPFLTPLPFLGDFGMRVVMGYLSFMIGSALLKISATVYMSIVMLLLYVISLFDNWHFLIVTGIMILVVAVAVYLSPKIWKRMAPGIANLAQNGEFRTRRAFRQMKRAINTRNPQSIEDMYEKSGEQKMSRRSIEEELENKQKQAQMKHDEEELRSLQSIKSNNPGEYVASGLDKREQQLSDSLQKQNLEMSSLTDLQKQRQYYENRKSSGDPISADDTQTLNMIQQAEQLKVRSMLQPSDQRTFDQLAHNQKSNYSDMQTLQQQKISNPMEFVASGGDAKMKYLQEKQHQNEQREREILKANTTPENEANKDLRQYIRSQGNESMLANHQQNLAPQLDEGRQLFIESMNHNEREAEQQVYETKLANNEQLSAEEQKDFFYLQHNDWKETISSIDSKEHQDKLQTYHTKETGYESQLKQLSHARENDQNEFFKMGGAVRQEEIQQNLYNVREQTQDVLRNSGNREAAEKHLIMAEQRDKMFNIAENSSTNPHLKLVNKQKEEKPLTHADIIRQAKEQRERENLNGRKRQ